MRLLGLMDVCSKSRYSDSSMPDVTQILNAIEQGNSEASEQLLPLIYGELRKLAASKMERESPDHTLQATALVHEAYIRLVGSNQKQSWDNRGHFFSAAAEAMRRILIDSARHRQSDKRGGSHTRIDLNEEELSPPQDIDELLALNDALDKLNKTDPQAAELVKLRYFAGFNNREAAEILNVSPRTATSLWTYARAWLHEELFGNDTSS